MVRNEKQRWCSPFRFDPKTQFVGSKVSGPVQFRCTNFDKLLIFFKDGTYKASNIPEKQYLENVAWVAIADKKTAFYAVYKLYRYFDETMELQYISADQDVVMELHVAPKGK